MEDVERNGAALLNKEKILLQLAVDMNAPGAAKAFQMARGWRSDTVSRSRIPDFSDGLVSMRELAVFEHKGNGPPLDEVDGKPRCKKWSLALWIFRNFFSQDAARKS